MKKHQAISIKKEWLQLLDNQHKQPDWPYPGQPYAASDSAAHERWAFWHTLNSEYSKRDITYIESIIFDKKTK